MSHVTSVLEAFKELCNTHNAALENKQKLVTGWIKSTEASNTKATNVQHPVSKHLTLFSWTEMLLHHPRQLRRVQPQRALLQL